jgi:isoamylase
VIIYEAHVKGLTLRHPGSRRRTSAARTRAWRTRRSSSTSSGPRRHRGRADAGAPVRPRAAGFLVDRGLTNYWGYNTIGFFAPHKGYAVRRAARRAGREFKDDGQGAAPGRASRSSSTWSTTTPPRATTSARRCASAASTTPPTTGSTGDPWRFYIDYTGTGNSLNVRHPHVLQLIMDSLRYWVTEMHVDGFRFDLAAALARQLHDVDKLSAFFDLVQQDPVVSAR